MLSVVVDDGFFLSSLMELRNQSSTNESSLVDESVDNTSETCFN
jgi:hypothetical protein